MMPRIKKVTVTVPADLKGKAGWYDTKGGIVYWSPCVPEGEAIPGLSEKRLDPAQFNCGLPADQLEFTENE